MSLNPVFASACSPVRLSRADETQRCWLLVCLSVCFLLTSVPSDARSAEVAGTEAGLPSADQPIAAYADHPQADLNRLHHLLFFQNLIPDEVQSQLPQERAATGVSDQEYYVPRWYFGKRAGEESDRRLFGGDVRISPRQDFSATQREELVRLLQAVAAREPLLDELEQQPLAKLMLQWDIASVWWALEKRDCDDAELLALMARAVAALAQPAAVLADLDSGIDDLLSQFGVDGPHHDTQKPYFPAGFSLADDPHSPWVEVGRNSSALFKADRSLHASRVFLNAGGHRSTVQLIESAAQLDGSQVAVPAETETILVQQLIGFDDQLQPVVTPVIDDVRVRSLHGPATLSGDNRTSSRDGSNHWVYYRTRLGSLRKHVATFRFVPDTDQSLFVEYGSLKHATFAAQCALCHRRTSDGAQAPEAIRSLARHAKPHVAGPTERRELALAEMARVTERLRQRLDSAGQADGKGLPAEDETEGTIGRLPPRPERSAAERLAWIAQLRSLYGPKPADWPVPQVDDGVEWREIGLLPAMQHPEENPHHEAKEQLGKVLFFDPRISGSQQIACASCHDPDLGWADGRTTSFGHGRVLLNRNAPTIRNSGHFQHLFWDGRATTLEQQVLHVLDNPSEMRAVEADIVSKLETSSEYRQMFAEAFGDETVTFQRVSEAIACFERTINGGRSRFDAFLRGREDALTDQELVGLDLFRREAGCMNCHHGPLFSDDRFHNLGLSYYGRRFQDLGRYEVTGEAADVGRFRTPSLRDVTRTAPMMHNGLFQLTGVLNMYNAGMATLKRNPDQVDDPLFPTKSPHLRSLGLNRQDLQDLAAFITALEEPALRVRPPRMPIIPEAEPADVGNR